jgi:RNA polymerase sigma factor (sigma-70 family)
MSPRIPTRLLATQSDQRLLDLARRGHERAFEVLVHRYRRPLLRYCARMGLADAGAEDVVQQSLLRAWLALERQAEVRELRPWLYRIVHNTAVNVLRSSRDDQHTTVEAIPGQAPAAESELERRIALRDALAGVAALPHMQREAIVLSAFAGQSQEEVADVLGVSDGAVRGLLYRARTTLRGAAAALTPQPLISWACGTGAATPTAERLAEISAPLGAAGMAGVLVKSAGMAVTAAVILVGSAVVHPERHLHSASPRAIAKSASAAASGSSLERTGSRSAAVVPAPTPLRLATVGSDGRAGGGRVDRSGGHGGDGARTGLSSNAGSSEPGQKQDDTRFGRSRQPGSDGSSSREGSDATGSSGRPAADGSGSGGSGGSGSGGSGKGTDGETQPGGVTERFAAPSPTGGSGASDGQDGSGSDGSRVAGGDQAAPAVPSVTAASLAGAGATTN